MLLQNNANVQEKGENGVTTLFVSAEKGYTDIITDLLKKQQKINQKGGNFASPIFLAAQDVCIVLPENNTNASEIGGKWLNTTFDVNEERHVLCFLKTTETKTKNEKRGQHHYLKQHTTVMLPCVLCYLKTMQV